MAAPKTEGWNAWLNMMPPGPPHIYVTGEVTVGNPGYEALLHKKVPQGSNNQILMLDLNLGQKPGTWPQVVVIVPARYEQVVPRGTNYTEVQIFYDGSPIITINVDIVT